MGELVGGESGADAGIQMVDHARPAWSPHVGACDGVSGTCDNVVRTHIA